MIRVSERSWTPCRCYRRRWFRNAAAAILGQPSRRGSCVAPPARDPCSDLDDRGGDSRRSAGHPGDTTAAHRPLDAWRRERCANHSQPGVARISPAAASRWRPWIAHRAHDVVDRSEEHTSELQSPCKLVCRLLLEKQTHHYGIIG